MASFPASNAYTENGIDRGTLRQRLTDHLASTVQLVGAGTVQALTIASGSITPASGASGSIVIDTEGAASSDTLTNISTANLPDGSHILIRIADNGRVVNVLDMAGGAGQIALADGLDHQLNLVTQWIELRRDGTDWTEVRRGGREAEFNVTPATGWTNLPGGGRMWKDDINDVRLKGPMQHSALASASSPMFTAPVGYRTLGTTKIYPVYSTVGGVQEINAISVATSGVVTFLRLSGAPASLLTNVYLDGVIIRAEV